MKDPENYDGLDIVDNPALSLFFGAPAPTVTKDTPGMQNTQIISLMLSPGEFSVSPDKHRKFVTRVCRYAQKNRVAVVGGTEAADSGNNNTHRLLEQIGPKYGFHVTANPYGEWLLVNRLFGNVVDARFIPVIPAQGGLASQGGHNPRGIVTNHIKPHNTAIGDVHVGVSHWLTKGTDLSSPRGKQNLELEKAIGVWAKAVGVGSNLVFHMGDTNLDDKHRDAYIGVPFTSCWDELHKWPVTHPHPDGTGPTLDVIASWDRDKRVKCKSARALPDTTLNLPVDHFSVLAEYAVQPIKKKGK